MHTRTSEGVKPIESYGRGAPDETGDFNVYEEAADWHRKELLNYSAGLSVDGVLPRNIAGLDTPQASAFRSHA